MSQQEHIIVAVDSDPDLLEWVKSHLGLGGVKVLTTRNSQEALDFFKKKRPSLIIANWKALPLDGIQLLEALRSIDPNATVILVADFPPTNAVIEAMKLGAYDFLGKPTLSLDLRPVVEAALRSIEQRAETRALDSGGPQGQAIDFRTHSIIGQSPAMQGVFKMIGRVSRSSAPITITGESGCGKEVVARAIFKFSPRSSQEFVAINCAAIPDNLLESELFGHEKGAFTGASTRRIGRFEQADGGTLFLDEIGDMPLQVQTKILRVLQEGEFTRVGSNETLRSDVRIIAATNKNLEKEVAKGHFREDLFYRLNVVRIHIPPLRERPEDIRPLANFFLQRLGRPGMLFSEAALTTFESYSWPGNVRELENTVHRALALATSDILLPYDIPLGPDASEGTRAHESTSLDHALEIIINLSRSQPDLTPSQFIERELTRFAITRHQPATAAEFLGITPAALQKRLAKFKLS
jgi:two-component system, NtrC family, nitrogen regulation response regulator GlnG